MLNVRQTLDAFDKHLARVSIELEATVIGGAALNLLGVVSRSTRDCDVLVPAPLPPSVLEEARRFAEAVRADGRFLADNWLNTGPASVADLLPTGWEERRQCVFEGEALILFTLGRSDLLRTKLFAYCDRGQDLGDCLALKPTARELRELSPWVQQQDANPDWPDHVRESLAELGRRLGHSRGYGHGL